MARIVLSSNREVAHFWAARNQPEGRAGNMFFSDGKIFSYGAHFCIARHLPNETIAFTTRGYSNSTSKHKSEVRNAARHLRIVYCHNPAGTARENMRAAREGILGALADSEKPRIHQATRIAHRGRALHLAVDANAYLAALPEDERDSEFPIDVTALEDIRAEIERAEVARAAMRREQEIARNADLLDSLAKWRTGEIHTRTGLYALPVALRLRGGAVQTSRGADIPEQAARALWPLILRARARSVEYAPDAPAGRLGAYSLQRIRIDGSIVVGCHDIAFSEIEGIAKQLGLVKEAQ